MDNSKNLKDDMLKTVRYWVSYEKRDYETVLYEHIDHVYDNLTDAQFTSWKMAEFMERWRAGKITIDLDIAPADRKYLTVDWEVVGRVERRKGRFEERKTDALEGIAKTLAEKEAWTIMDSAGRHDDLAVINPNAILGPLLDEDPGTSAALIARLMDGSVPAAARLYFPVIDVRDVAAAQVEAMLTPGAGGHRYVCAGARRECACGITCGDCACA